MEPYSIVIGLFIARPFIVLFHELGHAIPALIFTKGKVSVYMGSLGDPEKNIRLKIGRLRLWLKYDVFWRSGLCESYDGKVSTFRNLIILAGGPFATILLACLAAPIILSLTDDSAWVAVVIVLVISGLADLKNLIPNSSPIALPDGRYTHNDGYQIRKLLQYLKIENAHRVSIALSKEGKHKEAADYFERHARHSEKNEWFYKESIRLYYNSRQYDKTMEMLEQLEKITSLGSVDCAYMGLMLSRRDDHERAMFYYEQAISQDGTNTQALCNKGYTLNLQGKYSEAIACFYQALAVDASLEYCYSGMGLSKIMLGLEEEGLKDIHEAFLLNSSHSYAFKNLGLYHLAKGKYAFALDLFVKAKECDAETYQIDKLIEETNQKLVLSP